MIHTFAAIDVGSFELEMGIYEISSKYGIREIDHIKHMIPLGRDTYNDGKISYKLVEELCQILEEFSRIMKGYQVKDYRAYATSAMREAKNSGIVLDQIRVRAGIDIRVISNSEQRFISYKAIAAKDAEFQKTIQKGTAIVDVGFGSMQISLFDKDSLISTQNLPLGILRLRETLAHTPMPAKVQHDLIVEMVDNELITFRKMYLKDRQIGSLIGIGEPILTLSLGRGQGVTRDQITAEEFYRFFHLLKSMTMDQIEERFHTNASYAPMLLPSAIIYKRMMEVTGAEVMWVPGIRMTDGIAAEYAEDQKIIGFHHDFAHDIIVTSRNMAKRYKCHMTHVHAVEQAALEIFDRLKKYHGMKDRERLLLQIAVNLHSCGKFVTMRNTTDCAYDIIMATEIIGLSHLEREIVANVVRYHRQAFRYDEVRIEARPSRNSRLCDTNNLTLIVAKLTAILRLANSMDCSHKNKLEDCRIVVKDQNLLIMTDYDGDITFEELSIAQKADFFEEIFGIRPVLRQKRRG